MFSIRALEVHDPSIIWNLEEIRKRLKFMVKNDMNTLVLHEPGIEDKIVFPGKFLGAQKEGSSFFEIYKQIDRNIYNYALRENLNLTRRDYLKHIIEEAAEAGIEVYIENKELWFSDFIMKYKPDLVKNGVFCPSDPFWWEEFLPVKYRELFIALPGLAGVVTSFGTGESRLAISNMFTCNCERCRSLDPVVWYKNIALGMYKPFKEAGKKLIIRDFIYKKNELEKFAKALDELPDEIIISSKNTPHDFYPTFPNNPLIGHVGRHPQWIEYDVNGQFYGWGLAPSSMLKDLRRRLKYALDHKVTGFIARTDWEGVQDHSCFDTPNLLNLYGIAVLGKNLEVEIRDIYYKWLDEERMLREDLSSKELKQCLDWISEVFEETWPIIEKTIYIKGAVFSNDSAVHISLDQPTFIAETHHSLKDWIPEKENIFEMSENNIVEIIKEKEEAIELAHKVYNKFKEGNKGLKEDAYQKLLKHFEFLLLYTKAFYLISRAYVFAKYLLEKGEESKLWNKPIKTLLKEAIKDLNEYCSQLLSYSFLREYPMKVLLNPERFECFLKDIEEKIKL